MIASSCPQPADASNRTVVGLNVDTLYSFASLDVSSEPMVLSIPDMGRRYWVMQLIDAWNDVPHAPGSRTVGSKGGNFAIVGPKWTGALPGGLTELRVPTSLVLIGGRTYTAGKDDYEAVHVLQDQYKLVPLSSWGWPGTVHFHFAGGAALLAFRQDQAEASDRYAVSVGARNEAATREALKEAKIPVLAHATGGSTGRTVRVTPEDPRVVVKEAGSGERELFSAGAKVGAKRGYGALGDQAHALIVVPLRRLQRNVFDLGTAGEIALG